jgi:hypothetical protein
VLSLAVVDGSARNPVSFCTCGEVRPDEGRPGAIKSGALDEVSALGATRADSRATVSTSVVR